MSGFNGTSFDDSIGKGQNLKPNFGIFCPVELRLTHFRAFLELQHVVLMVIRVCSLLYVNIIEICK
jgi:hypothetical protein